MLFVLLHNHYIQQLVLDIVNPDARNHLRAATAEERIISVLAAFPEYYKRYKSELAAELFITEFNRRVFVSLCEIINDCKEINSTAFGGDYTGEQGTGQI